ncbi:MAG: M23 family metallopeptidase [Chitinophagales bacterium]|nr:M23 family metallopeptidase [Chitinophagales bacterium]MDW8417838.1 M23 family metallopeptidase [Chitinophagales bacterium]
MVHKATNPRLCIFAPQSSLVPRRIVTTENKNLKNKYRFVLLNDETFEEKFSLILTRTNALLFAGILAFTLIFLTAVAIIYTPLKYFIPGFGDYNYRSEIIRLQSEADSLESHLEARELWLNNLLMVLSDSIKPARHTSKPPPAEIDISKIDLLETNAADKDLRKEIEAEESFSLSIVPPLGNPAVEEIKLMHLLPPVQGYITEEFNSSREHLGIDIAVKQGEPVKATCDGSVVNATYSVTEGYVIALQHKNNLLSVYKHNARLLKKTGDAVKAGDVIGFAGNTGETSTGPHLHFELWHEGRALNPRDYILF